MPVFKNLTPVSGDIVMAILGGAVIVGWATGRISQQIKAPQVVGFIVLGVLLGNSFLGIFDSKLLEQLVFINYLALAFIGFDIGGELSFRKLKRFGKSITAISILESLGAFFLVMLGTYLLTRKLHVALIFGALACATAPAATVDVVREYHSSGPLTSTLFAVVGIDDAIAIIIYAFASLFAKTLLEEGSRMNVGQMIYQPLLEILYAVAIGVGVGLVVVWLIRKIRQREQLLVIIIGAIILVTGLANALHASLILANMVLGMTLVNTPRYGRRDVFDIVQNVVPPILILFFVLVGAQLQVSKLATLGAVGAVYIAFRFFGKTAGSWAGAKISGASPNVAKYLGLCLLSQAGVAIALAIQTQTEFRGFGHAGLQLGILAINVIAATTLVLQIAGPPLTRYAIIKAGEAKPIERKKKSEPEEKGEE